MSFKKFWATLRANLRPGDTIRNWTAAKGYLGDSFTIARVSDKAVHIDASNAATTQHVPRNDFELMHSLWKEYCSGQAQRQDIRDQTRFSKYTISIIKHLETGPT